MITLGRPEYLATSISLAFIGLFLDFVGIIRIGLIERCQSKKDTNGDMVAFC